MNADAFCIGLFLRSGNFMFSRHPQVRSLLLPKKKEAEAELGVAELFPLTYETHFRDAQGRLTSGEFHFPE